MTPLANHMAKPFVNRMGLRQPEIPSLREIIMRVCDKHGVTIIALKSPRRCKELVVARQEAAWECIHQTSASYPMVAREMNRDHTTILYSVEQYQKRLDAAKAEAKDAA